MSDKYISHFSDAYRPKIDGVSVSLELLHNELSHRDIAHDVYVPKTPGEYTDDDNIFRFSSIPLLFQPEIRFSVPLDVSNLKRAYSKHYSLVHSHSPGPMGLLAWQVAKLHRLPHIHTFHMYIPEYGHYIFDGKVLSKDALDELSQWWGQRSDVIIAPSMKIYNWLKRIGVTKEMHVIPSGIDRESFSEGQTNARYLIEHGFVNEDDFVLLFVGRVAHEKAIGKIFTYLSHLPESKRVGLKCVVVGGGPELPEFKIMASKAGLDGVVVFTDYIPVPDVKHAYASADVFGFVSTSETQGLVVTEAMAAGLPLLISSDDAYTGMLEDGENGYVSDSVDSFNKGLLALMGDQHKRRQFSAKSIELSKRFDIGFTIESLLTLYENVQDEYRVLNGPPRFASEVVNQYRQYMHDSMSEIRARLKKYVQT
ncbi:glycosyltransferase family 4 protein [bacterium]|nr:glycosyltransferase family 4 protein [bacterium]